MWELFVLLFLGFISLFILDPLFQREMEQTNRLQKKNRNKQEKMNFPSSHISTSLITPENSPCSSRITNFDSPNYLSRSSSRRSLFTNEPYDSTSDYCYND